VRILIASTIVPFIDGGGRMIVRDLETMLGEAGHEVDVLWIPYDSSWQHVPEQLLALRLTDVSDVADLLVTIRNPAHLLRHPNKVLWFIHHHRSAYDLWGTIYQDIPDTPAGHQVREAIIHADNEAFAEARRIFTNSQEVGDRLREFNGVESEVVYPPLSAAHRFHAGPYGPYVFYPSRLAHHKRQRLAIEAMRHVRSGARLVVAGAPDETVEAARLEAAIVEHGVEDRVELIARWISEEEKIELMAGARAGIYIPYDEDSYGYPSLEAFHSGKSVITCTDSGGTLELIEHERSGLVVPPEPEALGAAIDRLFVEDRLAERLGAGALERLGELQISRRRVVAAMTS
jgi:glycosyltransferase involved in cell wall biosynthesis